MIFSSLFQDVPEFTTRKNTPFTPSRVIFFGSSEVRLTDNFLQLTWNELYSTLPKQIFRKSTAKGLSYVARDVTLAVLLYNLGWRIDSITKAVSVYLNASSTQTRMIKGILWMAYINVQGILLTSWWCLAHEASHGTLSPSTLVNDVVGYTLHTVYIYYIDHYRNERLMRYAIIVSSGTVLLFTFQHFNPYSALFKPHERFGIIISDIGLMVMVLTLYHWEKQVGFGQFLMLYFLPYMVYFSYFPTTLLTYTDWPLT